VDIVLDQFEAANRRDTQAVMEVWGDDIVLILHGDLRGAGGTGASGREAVQRWFADWLGRFEEGYRFDVTETRDLGDRVLLVATHSGVGRGSGAPVSFTTSYIYTLDDGVIRRVEIWVGRDQALEAADLDQ
jgi:ketosteroid isomerase-like protein